MRKLLLLTTVLVCFSAAPNPAHADPITAAVATFLGGSAFATVVAGALVNLAGSLILSTLATALAGKPKQEQQRAELSRPTALPAYRYVYGTCWAPGTPVGWYVSGSVLYICYLLNSRPSALTTHTVLMDKRAVTVSGDPFDFTSSGGASATNEPFTGHLKYWIGRGSQTTCPAQIVSETGGKFISTDAWQGRTVLWARLDCGKQEERSERWPSTPPELNVEGDWSLVHDPRDGVTRHTRNQALIVRDALRTNPIRPYSDVYLWDETFEWGADVAEQTVAVKGGGSIPRYRCDGVLVFADGAELEDQIGPLLAAGASRLVRVGGKLGFIPAVARSSVYTVNDFTEGQPLEMTRWQPSDSLYTEVVARYTAPDRAYESAEAPTYELAGAAAADGGLAKRMDLQLDFVLDHRQAQRVGKIEVMRSRMQRVVSGELFPDAFRLVAGSVATVDLPAPMTPFNGLYEVETISPAAGVNDDQSITMRLPVVLRETSAAIYAWDAATEEQTVEGAVFDGSLTRVQRPASITVISGGGAALVSADRTTPRVQASWPPSASASAQAYEVQFRSRNPAASPPFDAFNAWQDVGTVDASSGNGVTYYSWVNPVAIGHEYEMRVRTVGLYGKSTWRASSAVVASGPTATLSAPVMLAATPGSSRITVRARQSWTSGVTTLRLFSSMTNDVTTATNFFSQSAGASVEIERIDLVPNSGETWYYWARAEDAYGNVSAYSSVISATVT